MARRGNAGRRGHDIDSIYLALSSINPLKYLIAYLLLIPIFALGFWVLSVSHSKLEFGRDQDFYAPYARREPGALADKRKVEENLTVALASALQLNLRAHPDWAVDGPSFQTYGLALPTEGEPSQGGSATFTTYISAFHRVKNERPIQDAGPNEFTLDLRVLLDDGTVACHSVSPPPTSPLQEQYSFSFELVLTTPPPHRMGSAMCWSEEAENQLRQLLSGWRGDPRGFSDLLPRLVYFSATTVTTTGFGDIVPLSNLARGLSGLEAVLGWIFAGLCLNAVAWRAGQATNRVASKTSQNFSNFTEAGQDEAAP